MLSQLVLRWWRSVGGDTIKALRQFKSHQRKYFAAHVSASESSGSSVKVFAVECVVRQNSLADGLQCMSNRTDSHPFKGYHSLLTPLLASAGEFG